MSLEAVFLLQHKRLLQLIDITSQNSLGRNCLPGRSTFPMPQNYLVRMLYKDADEMLEMKEVVNIVLTNINTTASESLNELQVDVLNQYLTTTRKFDPNVVRICY
jgi:uncharacterized protein YaaW (UPF0174 family)